MKKVLIVDDAIFMRNLLKDILVSEGYEVVGEAGNGEEAVKRYFDLKPDITTMDIVMPLKNGIEAVREIVGRDPKARIIMISALGQESLVMEAMEAGALDFITKPFTKEKVIQVIRKYME